MIKKYYKPILISIGCIIFQSIWYALSKVLGGNATILNSNLDMFIPFNVHSIIPYASWYFLLFILPCMLYEKDKKNFSKYIVAYGIITIIANIIFILFPTCVDRPNPDGNNLLDIMTKIVFWVDNPTINCFPSLHCAISMIWLLYTVDSDDIKKSTKILTSIWCILIMISTLSIKQHVFYDLVVGDVIAYLVFLFLRNDEVIYKKVKKMLKI